MKKRLYFSHSIYLLSKYCIEHAPKRPRRKLYISRSVHLLSIYNNEHVHKRPRMKLYYSRSIFLLTKYNKEHSHKYPRTLNYIRRNLLTPPLLSHWLLFNHPSLAPYAPLFSSNNVILTLNVSFYN